MNKLKIILLMASMLLAVTFTFSCSSDDTGNGGSSSSMGDDGNSHSYNYCLLSEEEICLDGPFTLKDCNSIGGKPSNSCPYGDVESSSSSVDDEQGGESSSSSEPPLPSSSSSELSPSSSSSEPPPSSSSYESSNESSVFYNGQTYKTVKIGEQVWFAENLNSDPGTGESACYSNQTSNCTQYGRLYDWATAMALSSSCNSNSCSSQIQQPHRGICPSGWHIPSNADWDKLYRYADGTSSTSSPYFSITAGRYLKATEGWLNCGPSSSYFCEDAYGFSALPGGQVNSSALLGSQVNSDGSFSGVGS